MRCHVSKKREKKANFFSSIKENWHFIRLWVGQVTDNKLWDEEWVGQSMFVAVMLSRSRHTFVRSQFVTMPLSLTAWPASLVINKIQVFSKNINQTKYVDSYFSNFEAPNGFKTRFLTILHLNQNNTSNCSVDFKT